MIRSIAIVLALVAGSVAAGETMDCYNDETEVGTRYTSTEAEVLRVSDADITDMLRRIREYESRAVASAERDPALYVSLDSDISVTD